MKKFVMIDSQTLPDADFHQEKEILQANGIECVLATCKTIDEVVKAAHDAACIGNNYFRVDEELLSRLSNLKIVIRYGIGYDVVDVDACTRRGILLCNLPKFCLPDVATHAIAMVLDLSRKVTLYDRQVRSGNWDVGYGYKSHRLETRTIGVIGFGNIARQFCKYASVFCPNIIVYDPYVPAEVLEKAGVKKVELDVLYKEADIISIHVPNTPDTYHMINAASINKMKDGVMIVNTSRGPLVENDALVEGLMSGKITAAGLDVVDGEPIRDANNPLFKCENLIVSPHTSYNSVESSDDQHTQVAETAVTFFKDLVPVNTVNKKALGLN
ncbi:MAG: C-terminal binding protein [Flexilinea sp.]